MSDHSSENARLLAAIEQLCEQNIGLEQMRERAAVMLGEAVEERARDFNRGVNCTPQMLTFILLCVDVLRILVPAAEDAQVFTNFVENINVHREEEETDVPPEEEEATSEDDF